MYLLCQIGNFGICHDGCFAIMQITFVYIIIIQTRFVCITKIVFSAETNKRGGILYTNKNYFAGDPHIKILMKIEHAKKHEELQSKVMMCKFISYSQF